jgi:hypothetical protein
MVICSHKYCQKRAVFGYSKSDKILYCKTHKHEDMINVKNIIFSTRIFYFISQYELESTQCLNPTDPSKT